MCLGEEEGQGTVEYLLVLLGTIAVVVGLAAFVKAGADGTFARLASASLSHSLGEGALGALADVLLY